ncbi:MAG: acyltransferase family protein, partial [Bacteroidales bacterium]
MRAPIFDLLRCICAFCVICIHYNFPAIGENILPIFRSAVPVFFAISGYFLFSKGLNEINLLSALRKTIYTLIQCTLFYFVYALGLYVFSGENHFYMPSVKGLFLGLLFDSFPFIGLMGHLWYLSALIYIFIALIIILKTKASKYIFHAILPLCLICITYNYIGGLYPDIYEKWHIPNNIIFSRNFLFTGIPFFLMGAFFSKYQSKIQLLNLNLKAIYGSLFIALCFCVLEYLILGIQLELYISNIAVAFLTLLLCIN